MLHAFEFFYLSLYIIFVKTFFSYKGYLLIKLSKASTPKGNIRKWRWKAGASFLNISRSVYYCFYIVIPIAVCYFAISHSIKLFFQLNLLELDLSVESIKNLSIEGNIISLIVSSLVTCYLELKYALRGLFQISVKKDNHLIISWQPVSTLRPNKTYENPIQSEKSTPISTLKPTHQNQSFSYHFNDERFSLIVSQFAYFLLIILGAWAFVWLNHATPTTALLNFALLYFIDDWGVTSRFIKELSIPEIKSNKALKFQLKLALIFNISTLILLSFDLYLSIGWVFSLLSILIGTFLILLINRRTTEKLEVDVAGLYGLYLQFKNIMGLVENAEKKQDDASRPPIDFLNPDGKIKVIPEENSFRQNFTLREVSRPTEVSSPKNLPTLSFGEEPIKLVEGQAYDLFDIPACLEAIKRAKTHIFLASTDLAPFIIQHKTLFQEKLTMKCYLSFLMIGSLYNAYRLTWSKEPVLEIFDIPRNFDHYKRNYKNIKQVKRLPFKRGDSIEKWLKHLDETQKKFLEIRGAFDLPSDGYLQTDQNSITVNTNNWRNLSSKNQYSESTLSKNAWKISQLISKHEKAWQNSKILFNGQ